MGSQKWACFIGVIGWFAGSPAFAGPPVPWLQRGAWPLPTSQPIPQPTPGPSALSIAPLAPLAQSRTQTPPRRSGRPNLRLLAFELRGLGVLQPRGGSAYTGQLDWLPTYQFHPRWGAKLALGASFLKASSDRGAYPGLSAGAYGWGAPLRTVEVGVGGGLELWPGNGGLAPLAGVYASWVFPRPVFRFFERATVAYSHLFSAVSAEQVSGGIGVLF